MEQWSWEQYVPGKGWVNEAELTGPDHLSVATAYGRGEAPPRRCCDPDEENQN